VLARFSNLPLSRLKPNVLEILRLGAYQLLFLSRIPASAAVDESVRLADREPKHIKGYVNAVLRAVSREGASVPFPDPRRAPAGYLAAFHSHPKWLVERYLDRLGFEEAERLLAANNEHPPLTARVNSLKVGREEVIGLLAQEGVGATPTGYSPLGLTLANAGDPSRLKALKEGLLIIQDEAAQLVSYLLDPRPGERVLDAASGRGGKTTHLGQLTQGKGRLVAMDTNPRRLEELQKNALLLGIEDVRTVQHDATEPLEGERFDRVLLDAPCTGTGVIRRHPEIKWRRGLGDVTRLAALQRSMLEALAPSVANGGVLVYAACSLEPEEGEELIEGFLRDHTEFSLEPADLVLGLKFPEKGRFLRTFPHRSGMDGFFAARLIKACQKNLPV